MNEGSWHLQFIIQGVGEKLRKTNGKQVARIHVVNGRVALKMHVFGIFSFVFLILSPVLYKYKKKIMIIFLI